MSTFSRYPVVNLAAEYLAMGFLMRRNILAYKAPSNNEGYDIICIHPDPRRSAKPIRVQVKSRIATDSDKGVLVRPKSLQAFDFLIVVYLNIGYFLRRSKTHSLREGDTSPELLVLPREIARMHLLPSSGWGKMRFAGLDVSKYRGSAGIELIARRLRVAYPSKAMVGT